GGIWVGTDRGVFYSDLPSRSSSTASTTAWAKVGTSLPNVAISGLEIDYKIGKIRAATRGRGVWEHDLICPSNLSYNLIVTHTSNKFIEAVNEIISISHFLPTVSVTYRAGSYIKLNPGFLVTPNNN